MIIFLPPGAEFSLFASKTASSAPKASSPPVLKITETSSWAWSASCVASKAAFLELLVCIDSLIT